MTQGKAKGIQKVFVKIVIFPRNDLSLKAVISNQFTVNTTWKRGKWLLQEALGNSKYLILFVENDRVTAMSWNDVANER